MLGDPQDQISDASIHVGAGSLHAAGSAPNQRKGAHAHYAVDASLGASAPSFVPSPSPTPAVSVASMSRNTGVLGCVHNCLGAVP